MKKYAWLDFLVSFVLPFLAGVGILCLFGNDPGRAESLRGLVLPLIGPLLALVIIILPLALLLTFLEWLWDAVTKRWHQ